MIFKSHFYAMIIFSIIVSTLLAFIRFDEKKDILKYGLKIFLYMSVGVIIFSWVMHYI